VINNPDNDIWLLLMMVFVALGCAGVFIYFFYVLMAKLLGAFVGALLGAFVGALVGAFVAGYHLFVH
jgi:hypothetical protein